MIRDGIGEIGVIIKVDLILVLMELESRDFLSEWEPGNTDHSTGPGIFSSSTVPTILLVIPGLAF